MSKQLYYIVRRFYFSGCSPTVTQGEAWDIGTATDLIDYLRQTSSTPCDYWLVPA